MQQIEQIDFSLAGAEIANHLQDLQQKIINLICLHETSTTFITEPWKYSTGGGGITCVLEGGEVIEKAGVNFSRIYGAQLPKSATRSNLSCESMGFHAIGLSVIIHPRNPYVPTTHANWRFITVEEDSKPNYWWFGGGFDLTPYYAFDEDCIYWHSMAKKACLPFGEDVYPWMKKWCDDYFYLKHRQESRGIGGIFYDDLNNVYDSKWNFATSFNFMQTSGQYFAEAYNAILDKRKRLNFTDYERSFQSYRRGRYVEFNLLYDRGTLFGLQSAGRTESILVSLPPQVSWPHSFSIVPGSKEDELSKFLQPRKWI